MTLVTEISRHPSIEFSLSEGALADASSRWTIKLPEKPTTLERRPHEPIVIPNETDPHLEDAFAPSALRRATPITPSSIAVNWTRLTHAGLSSTTHVRLRRIAARPDSWRGVGSRRLNSASLTEFLGFWAAVRTVAAEPMLTLLPNGHLGAEWYKNGQRHLDLEFSQDGLIYFGFFNGPAVFEGKASRADLVAMLLAQPSKPLRWRSR